MAYMIGIAAQRFDPEGAFIVPWRDGTRLDDVTRRVSRTRTLDGGVAITNRGYSAGDTTAIISMDELPRKYIDMARRFVRLHPTITLSTPSGCFVGVPSEYQESRKELTVLIVEEA